MAKKPDFNQSAEIRSILQKLGDDAKFRDVFAKLQTSHKGYRFNENSCMQAFAVARKKLGIKKGRRVKRVMRPRAVARRISGENHGQDVMKAGLTFIRLAGGVENARKRLAGLEELIETARAVQ